MAKEVTSFVVAAGAVVGEESGVGLFSGGTDVPNARSAAATKVSASWFSGSSASVRAPEAMLCDFEVVTKSGDSHSIQVAYHKGHYKNPLSDSEVDAKFRSLAQKHLTTSQIDTLLNSLWHLEEVQDVGDVIRMAVF